MGEAIIYLDRVGEVEEGTAVSDLCAGGILAGSADGDATTFSERLLGVEVDGVDDDPSGGISAFHSHRHSHRNRNRNRNRNRGGNRGGGTSLPFFLSLGTLGEDPPMRIFLELTRRYRVKRKNP